MKSKPLVSVVMITYGHEKFICEAIEGVLMQKCDFEVELILSNDSSPDGTEDIVQELLKNHPKSSWIKYFNHSTNLGMMKNFLFALQQAKGEFIALCDGDDYWIDPLKLQKQIDFLENNQEFSILTSRCKVLKNDGSLNEWFYPIENFNELSRKKQFSNLLLTEKWLPVLNTVFRNKKDILMNLIIHPYNFPGDMQLFFKNLKVGKLYFFEEIHGVYRVHSASFSRKEMVKSHNELYNAIYNYKIKVAFKELLLKVVMMLFLKKLINKNNFRPIILKRVFRKCLRVLESI